MNVHHRPWWLPVNRPVGLVTTVEEKTRPGERVFTIRGEPVIQGLAWLTWGPAAAVLVVSILAVLAVALNIKEQSPLARGLMILAFVALPAIAWGVVTLIVTRLSAAYIQAERQANSRTHIIRLNRDSGEIILKTGESSPEIRLPFGSIQRVRVAAPIGGQDGKALQLLAETKDGPIILLDEHLGTRSQKIDLAQAINMALQTYGSR